MDDSTLPPLLGTYMPSYEEERAKSMASRDTVESEQEDREATVDVDSIESKSKAVKAQHAHRRQMEAEEKAYKEKEEKALHMLKMWNMVKDNERKRKQRILRDKISLQHNLIKKQDELHEILMQQQLREEKEKLQSPRAKFEAFEKLDIPELKPRRKRLESTSTLTHSINGLSSDGHSSSDDQVYQSTMKHDVKPSPIYEDDTLSEEDLSRFMQDNTMEHIDFYKLRHQPIKMQLEHLLGDSADAYLHPTIKESARKGPNPVLTQTKGYHGATVLWETLRDFSRQKLRNKDALILPDVKNAYACFVRECLRRHITPVQRNFVSEEEKPVSLDLEESALLKDVRFRRHRQELMFRVAHINKEKTRVLLHNAGPHYVNTMKADDGLRRFHPQLQDEIGTKLPEIDTTIATQLSNGSVPKKYKLSQTTTGKLVFLTEAKASCKGQFSERLRKTPEENPEQRIPTKISLNTDKTRFKDPNSQHTIYEPLTMDALVNQTLSSFEKHGNGRLVQRKQPRLDT